VIARAISSFLQLSPSQDIKMRRSLIYCWPRNGSWVRSPRFDRRGLGTVHRFDTYAVRTVPPRVFPIRHAGMRTSCPPRLRMKGGTAPQNLPLQHVTWRRRPSRSNVIPFGFGLGGSSPPPTATKRDKTPHGFHAYDSPL
jgi:hypothetical protein